MLPRFSYGVRHAPLNLVGQSRRPAPPRLGTAPSMHFLASDKIDSPYLISYSSQVSFTSITLALYPDASPPSASLGDLSSQLYIWLVRSLRLYERVEAATDRTEPADLNSLTSALRSNRALLRLVRCFR